LREPLCLSWALDRWETIVGNTGVHVRNRPFILVPNPNPVGPDLTRLCRPMGCLALCLLPAYIVYFAVLDLPCPPVLVRGERELGAAQLEWKPVNA
jgi:hypothetical protein